VNAHEKSAKACVAIALALLLAVPGFAGGTGQGNGTGHKPQGGGQVMPSGSQVSLSAYITAGERQTIRGYFQQHPTVAAGVKPLPPGIAKKIARGGAMPPGIAKRYFPADLVGILPPRPGQQWVIAGTDVLLVEVATNVVIDLLRGAL
jgi:hypothetical protein